MPRLAARTALLAALALAGGEASAFDRASVADIRAKAASVARLAASPSAPNAVVFDAARELLAGVGGTDNAAPVQVATAGPDGAPHLSLMPIDLLLSQIAFQTGANYHLALREAQASAKPHVLVLDQGTITLSALRRALAGSKFEALVTPTGDGLIAHAPLVIWSGAMLVLEPGDRLALDGSTGAFLITAGRLVSNAGTIEGVGPANPRQPLFRPFALVALSGSAELQATTFRNLGFRDHQLMTGLSFIEGGLYPAKAVSYVRDSLFERTGSLAFFGSSGTAITGNRFVASEGSAILIDGGKDISIERNIIAAPARGHGIKITSGADKLTVDDNIIVAGGSHGIFADRGTTNISIRRNMIAGNDGVAVRLVQTACVEVVGNAIVANAEKGVSVRQSIGVDIAANLFAGNRNAGVAIAQQPALGVTTVSNNTFVANRTGVSGSAYAALKLSRNDFSRQMPRLLAGELVQHSSLLLAAMADHGGLLSLASAPASSKPAAAGFSPFNLESCLGEESN